MSSDFDRIKPPEKRVLERRESGRSPSGGRAALFSDGAVDAPSEERPPRDRDDRLAGAQRSGGAEPGGGPARPSPAARRRSVDVGGGAEPGASEDAGEHHVRAVPRSDDATEPQPPRGHGGGSGLLRVTCDRCGETSSVDAGTALRSAIPLVLVAPWRSHPLFATCPACRRRSWLRPGVGPLG